MVAAQHAAQVEARIEELKGQERDLAAEHEQLEKELFLVEGFVRAKVEMLESKINSRFKLARFKLFNEQINGGLQECCEVLFDGVPYNSGLNTGARINVGLDIIRTLSEYYQKSFPVIIDNAEAVVDLEEIDAQIICMFVSKKHRSLKWEGK